MFKPTLAAIALLMVVLFVAMPRQSRSPIQYPCFLDGESLTCINDNGMVNYYRQSNGKMEQVECLIAEEARKRW
jgi:hypothetical protein